MPIKRSPIVGPSDNGNRPPANPPNSSNLAQICLVMYTAFSLPLERGRVITAMAAGSGLRAARTGAACQPVAKNTSGAPTGTLSPTAADRLRSQARISACSVPCPTCAIIEDSIRKGTVIKTAAGLGGSLCQSTPNTDSSMHQQQRRDWQRTGV